MRYDLEGDPERKQSAPPPARAAEQQPGDRERLASAVGNSGMARAAASGHAPPSLLSGAPMSVARSLELEDAPEEVSTGHDEHAEPGPAPGHELAPEAGAGQDLVPHEATHVAQQGPGAELDEER